MFRSASYRDCGGSVERLVVFFQPLLVNSLTFVLIQVHFRGLLGSIGFDRSGGERRIQINTWIFMWGA